MNKILIAEDENAIRDFIAINLRLAGYIVEESCDGNEAIEKFESDAGLFDLVLLDIMMPKANGLAVAKRIRSKNSNIGIIILSAKTQENDKITGLKSGADDYITKPFSVAELLARVESVCRRVELNKKLIESNTNDEYISGKFTLNTKRRSVFADNTKIELSQIEFEILEYFFHNPNKTISRTDILRHVWGDNYYGDDKVVDVNIRRLRIKIEKDPSQPEFLTTDWGKGYRWIEK